MSGNTNVWRLPGLPHPGPGYQALLNAFYMRMKEKIEIVSENLPTGPYRILVLGGSSQPLNAEELQQLQKDVNRQINEMATDGYRIKVALDTGTVGFVVLEKGIS